MDVRTSLYRLSVSFWLLTLWSGGIWSTALAQQTRPATDASESSVAKRNLVNFVSATGPRSSPFDPPEANDHLFVTDSAPKLDTPCIFRSSGPIVYNIEIT